MTSPIRPEEVTDLKIAITSASVYEVFNTLIARSWNGSSSSFKQEDVVQALVNEHNVSREEVFEQHMLDVEDVYRKNGWVVVYDKPGYNESYSATFTFSKPKQ